MSSKPSLSERVARAITSRLFFSVEADYTRVFGWPLRIIVVAALLGIIALSAPPVIDLVRHTPSWPFESISADYRLWKAWLPFATTVLEILLALLIGGSVFGEWAAAQSKKALEQLQKSVDASLKLQVVDASDVLEVKIRHYRENYRESLNGITLVNLPHRVIKLILQAKGIMDFVVKDVPRTNARFIVAKIAIAFPGGFFGLFAFLVFGVLSFAKVLVLYVDRVAVAGGG